MKKSSARKISRSRTPHSSLSHMHLIIGCACLVLVCVISVVALQRMSQQTVLGAQSGHVYIAKGDDGNGGGSEVRHNAIPIHLDGNLNGTTLSGQRGSALHQPEVLTSELEHQQDRESTVSSGNVVKNSRKIDQKGRPVAKQAEKKIKIEIEDDHVVTKEIHADGKETDMDQHDAVQELNDNLKEKEVAVSTASANRFLITKHGIHAQTQLPLSADPITHELSVGTGATEKMVTVLPDIALSQLLQKGIISRVDGTRGLPPMVLSLQDGKPIFTIKGTHDKKLFGLFARTFNKTAIVSAESGDVMQIDESAVDRFLESLSF